MDENTNDTADLPPVQPMPAAPEVEESVAADAKMRLRAWEDERFGEDAVRFDGKVERGIGSRFQNMSDAEKAEHAALERLVEAEAELLKATAALKAAQEKHAAASDAVEARVDAE